jgi:pSer/pThr/pTyr-binding forkhead associated (FHA) protein
VNSTLIRQFLAGAAGGLLVFLALEPGYYQAGWSPGSLFGGEGGAFLPGVLFAGIVTACLVAVDDLWTGNAARIAKRTVGIAGMAVVLGWGYSIIAHTVYGVLAGAGYGDLFARGAAWAFFGLGVGLCAGLASRSTRRAMQGCAGGLVGGFLGGAAFSVLLSIGGAGSLSRCAGFMVLGAAVGLATAVAEHLTRSHWVTFLSGSREGRQVALYHEENALGRSELAIVPLFGDPLIDPVQAVITLRPFPVIREVAAEPLLRVNGSEVREAKLEDGAVVQIGPHVFRFHSKLRDELPDLFGSGADAASALGGDSPFPGIPVLSSIGRAESDEPFWPTPVPLPEGGLALRVKAGGGIGRSVLLTGTSCTLGRELDNTLSLPDPKISRYHVQIVNVEGAWLLADLGSTNGTRLNGIHITRAGLAPGDFLYLGDTVISVESAREARGRDNTAATPQATA